MAELWAGGAILFLQKAFHRDLTQLNPAFQNLKISLLELEQRNKAFYTSKYHFCNWGKSKIKIQINDELQNHTNRKQCKSLHEITYQRSLLASAQRLGGHGLQGLSFSPLSPLSVIINWYQVISCGSYMTGEQRHDCREFVWTLFKTKDEWDGSSKWRPLFTILFKTFVWTSRPKKNGAGPVLFNDLLKSSRLCPKGERTTLLENLSKTNTKLSFLVKCFWSNCVPCEQLPRLWQSDIHLKCKWKTKGHADICGTCEVKGFCFRPIIWMGGSWVPFLGFCLWPARTVRQ